jgi:hypothetical protein
MSLLTVGQTGKAWEPSKKQRSFENREQCIEKYIHFFTSLKTVKYKVFPLSFPRARKFYRIESLHPLGYSVRDAQLREITIETLCIN